VKSNKKKKLSLLQLGAVFLFVGLIITAALLWQRIGEYEGSGFDDNNKTADGNLLTDWQEYTNEDFKYSLAHPKFLYIREIKNQGDYLSFTRFEENQYSKGKGIAIGVREASMEDEVKKLREEFEKDEVVKLVREEKLEVVGKEAIRLDYQPIEGTEAEERSIVIISDGKFTYSISTVPEQMDSVIAFFKLW
jgi:hypothetical protein